MLHYHAQEYLSIEMHGSLKETLTKFFNIERVSDIPVCEIEQFWAYSETKKRVEDQPTGGHEPKSLQTTNSTQKIP
jgi:hypothetical protein